MAHLDRVLSGDEDPLELWHVVALLGGLLLVGGTGTVDSPAGHLITQQPAGRTGGTNIHTYTHIYLHTHGHSEWESLRCIFHEYFNVVFY